MLSNNPAVLISTLAIFLISLSIHEYAHAWMAYRFGDETAKSMGRLTLNPIAHIDLFGTIILPLLVGFGWAKPVPVDFTILNKRQIFLVAAAGPLSNILLAVILAIAFHILPLQTIPVLRNFVLFAILFNLMLAVFNLIPIPPLDGSRMVFARVKSPRAVNLYRNISRFGILILIAFLWLGGFNVVVWPLVGLFYGLLGLPLPTLTIEQIETGKQSR
jgi:Zn-dependent protease